MKDETRKKIVRLLHGLIIVLIAIQPLIDMDYLFYEFLDSFGLPRFSTVLRFLILPALVILSFVLRETKKKRTFVLAAVYGVLCIGYFFLHCRQAQALFPRLAFTENFHFGLWQELTYVLTLAIPYGMMYVFYHEHFHEEELKKMTMFLSAVTGIPIFIGDLFVFGKSTYYGYTVANFFSWFTDIYDWYHPRELASKFFFNEGNTIGILMFMVLPMMYYFFSREKDSRTRKLIGILIFIQSMSMQILATRVATYGAVLIPVMFLGLYLAGLFFTKEKLQKSVLVFCLSAAAVFGLILDHTPAVENQRVDAINDTALLHNGMAAEGAAMLAEAKDLIPGTPEYINFYVYMFETYGINARYIQSVPSMYYTEYYNYQVDPKFWTDVCFMPVFDRVSGRQIETIFFNYKYQNLTQKEKILGMGWSTSMNGSIVLEQDFKQQIYTLGYAGEVLLVLPWIGVLLYGVFMFLCRYKKLFTLSNVCMALALGMGLGSAWLSGHVLDQFITTSFAALLVAVLLNRVKEAE